MASKITSLQQAIEYLDEVKNFCDGNLGGDDEYVDEKDSMEQLSEAAEGAKDAVDTFYGEWEDRKNEGEDEGEEDEDDEDTDL